MDSQHEKSKSSKFVYLGNHLVYKRRLKIPLPPDNRSLKEVGLRMSKSGQTIEARTGKKEGEKERRGSSPILGASTYDDDHSQK